MFVSSEIAGGRVVKGAPYAATATSETTQTLMDGNRIVRSASTRLARDGEGRTRQERSDGSIYLHDPAAGKAWLLRPKDKVAIELPRPLRVHVGGDNLPHAHSPEEMRSWADAMRQWAHEFSARWRAEAPEARREGTRAVPAPAAADSRVIVARAPKGEGAAVEREVRVEVVSAGEVPPRAAARRQCRRCRRRWRRCRRDRSTCCRSRRACRARAASSRRSASATSTA